MEVTFAIRLPTEAGSVPVIRALCRTNLEQLRVTPDCIEDIALAVTEACANAVRHSGDSSDFEVRINIADDVCRIVISDSGTGFAPDAVAVSTRLSESGRGIELMRLLVDELHYEPDAAGTAVTLVKALEILPGSPLRVLRIP